MRTRFIFPALTASILTLVTAPLSAQQTLLVYRLGKDTLAIEQYTRTATRLSGEMVQRTGPAVVRLQYDINIGSDGRPTAATLKRFQGDGTLAPYVPSEFRFRVSADSIVRELVFADSTQRRAFAASKALINFPVFVYGPTELLAGMRRAGGAADSVPALGVAGGLGFAGLEKLGGDTTRLRGGPYAMLLRFDANSRLLSLDGSFTTNKAMATRATGNVDIAAIAKTLKPAGVLSVRDLARAGFGPGGMVLIDYGRPLVRERTVWGGTLIPFDSVWRAGANDATHLFTTRTLTIGSMTLLPGTYTLWIQHKHDGTFLIVSKLTGIWGTQYDPSQDLGRVAMQVTPTPGFVEEFAIAVRATGANKGVIEMAWGPTMVSVPFGVSAAR